MKLVRPIIITLGIVILFGVLAAGLALTPAFQRWAVLRAAARQSGLQLKLDSVSAGLSSVSLRGVQLEHRGISVSLEQLEAEYSLWALLSARRLEIAQLSAQGVLVDASRLSSAHTQAGIAAAPAAASGALARVTLPWDLVLGEIDLQGKALLAGAPGQPALQGEFKLNGGQIGPGREGVLRLKARVTDPAPGASVSVLDALATMQIRESRQRTFDQINLTSLLEAVGPGLTGQNQLKLAAGMTRGPAGENYRVTVDTLRAGQSDRVLALNAVLTPDGESCAGDWELSVRSAQVQSFLLGHALPEFAAQGSGGFTFFPTSRKVSLQGGLQVEMSELEKLHPELRTLGPVRLKVNFAAGVDVGVVRLNKLEIALAGAQPVFELRTTGSPAFDFRQRRFEPAGGTPGEIFRVNISGLPFAWVAPFCSVAEVSGGPISSEISVRQGEGNHVTVETVAPLQVADIAVTRAGRTLLSKAALKLEAEAELSASKAQAKIRALTLTTAAGDSVQAKFSLTAPLGLRLPVAVEGDFTADLPALLIPVLPAGPLKARGTIGLNWQRDRLEVLRFSAESTDAKDRLLGSVMVTRAFVFDLVRRHVETGDAAEVQLASIKIGQLPLVSLGRVFPDYGVSGRIAPAEAIISAAGEKLTLRATAPVSILDFSVMQKKRTLLDRLKVQLQPSLELANGVVTQAQSGKVSLLTDTDVSLAELNLELTQSGAGMLAVSSFNCDLPAWATQPGLIGRDALSSGQASGEVRAAFAGGTAQIEARATLNGMVASESGQTLPVANLNLRAVLDTAGKFSVQAPVLLDRAGQRSDLRFSADGKTVPEGLSFEARLSSEHLELDDLLMLLAVAGSPLGSAGQESVAAQSRALSPPAADHSAFWAGTTGSVSVDCQSVVSGHDWVMSGLTGRLTVAEDRLQLEKLEASFGENSQFTAKGELAFAVGLNPYQLTGEFSLTEFDTARFFKALDPEHAPTVEGLFTVRSRLEGQGLTFADTIDRTRGSFDLTSRKGVYRGMRRSTDRLSMASKTLVLVSSLLGDNAAEKIAGVTYYSDQLVQELGEIPFDQLTINLVREASLNLRLKNITLVSPQVHFLGSGEVQYVAGQPLVQQPLAAVLSLRVRGKAEEILGKLKVLDGTRDELGFARSKETLVVGGSFARPNADAFFAKLAAGKLNDLITPPAN